MGVWWQYLLLFLAVAASWIGLPVLGTAALGAAAVAASQGRFNLAGVIVTAIVASEVGGLIGYAIGNRWGRRFLERPGRRQAQWQRMVERGERIYQRWGRVAVFFTPAVVSGTAKMQPRQFAVWNLIDAVGWTHGRVERLRDRAPRIRAHHRQGRRRPRGRAALGDGDHLRRDPSASTLEGPGSERRPHPEGWPDPRRPT